MDKLLYKERGGLRIGMDFAIAWNLSWPFVKLELFKEKIILTIFHFKKIEFKKHEIKYIEKYKGAISVGARIAHGKLDTKPFVLFWSFSVDRLLNNIREAGYPVQ